MAMLRHATRSFAFRKPGEPFEVYDKDVDKYVNLYGCEVVEPPKPKITITNDPEVMAENRKKIEAELTSTPTPAPKPRPKPKPRAKTKPKPKARAKAKPKTKAKPKG
jgi:hypothetical protein